VPLVLLAPAPSWVRSAFLVFLVKSPLRVDDALNAHLVLATSIEPPLRMYVGPAPLDLVLPLAESVFVVKRERLRVVEACVYPALRAVNLMSIRQCVSSAPPANSLEMVNSVSLVCKALSLPVLVLCNARPALQAPHPTMREPLVSHVKPDSVLSLVAHVWHVKAALLPEAAVFASPVPPAMVTPPLNLVLVCLVPSAIALFLVESVSSALLVRKLSLEVPAPTVRPASVLMLVGSVDLVPQGSPLSLEAHVFPARWANSLSLEVLAWTVPQATAVVLVHQNVFSVLLDKFLWLVANVSIAVRPAKLGRICSNSVLSVPKAPSL